MIFVIGAAIGMTGTIAGASGLQDRLVADPPPAAVRQGKIRLLAAKDPLQIGATLTLKNLLWVERPESEVPPGSFTSLEALFGPSGGERRIVLRSIDRGEPILEQKITRPGQVAQLATELGPNMRAVSIPIDGPSGVAGFLVAGDRVDVLLTRIIDGHRVYSVIVQDVELLAAPWPRVDEDPAVQQEFSVTLSVSTMQAQKIAVVQQVGRLSLILRDYRSPSDELNPLPPEPRMGPDFKLAFPPVLRRYSDGVPPQQQDVPGGGSR